MHQRTSGLSSNICLCQKKCSNLRTKFHSLQHSNFWLLACLNSCYLELIFTYINTPWRPVDVCKYKHKYKCVYIYIYIYIYIYKYILIFPSLIFVILHVNNQIIMPIKELRYVFFMAHSFGSHTLQKVFTYSSDVQ